MSHLQPNQDLREDRFKFDGHIPHTWVDILVPCPGDIGILLQDSQIYAWNFGYDVEDCKVSELPTSFPWSLDCLESGHVYFSSHLAIVLRPLFLSVQHQ